MCMLTIVSSTISSQTLQGAGEQVVKVPSTGNETVLDAISQIGGLSAVSSKRLWIARPAPNGCGDQILPVDWKGITRRGTTGTNYQLFPGDRLFVMSNPMSKLDTILARSLAPVQRVLGAHYSATRPFAPSKQTDSSAASVVASAATTAAPRSTSCRINNDD